ncbi:hypothetical protein Tco_0672610 [Tanacetum coccineum]
MSHRLAVITVTLLQSTRKDTTITTSLPEITPFIALQLRVARLEQEMSEVKKTDHSADVLASIRSQVPTAVDKYLGTESMMLPKVLARTQQIYSRILWVDWPRVYPNQESERVEGVYQNPKGNKIKSANRNPANYHLYHALMEAFIADEDVMDKEVADKVKDHKRKHDSNDDEDDDDDEGPSAGSNQARESDASATKQHPTLTSTGWQITDTRDAGADSSMHRSDPESEHSEQSSDDIPMQDEGKDSDMEDTDNVHIPKVLTTTWFKPIPESKRPDTPEPEWTIPPNDFPEPENNWANTYATTYKVSEENKLQRKTYDIGSFHQMCARRSGKEDSFAKADLEMDECHKLLTNKVDLSNPEGHQIPQNIYDPLPLGGPPGQVKRGKIALSISKLKAARYLDFGLEELVPSFESSDREAVRSQMRILSVISVKVFEKYGYNYLREIILRRADYQEYKISEKDFKNLHPNDFEDLFLLNIQEKLNHLPKTDKTSLHTAVNMWIRNLVIRNRVGDLQLGIESYQTKINLERPNWDAADYYFKEDYTIVPKPRAVVYRDRNDQRKLMRLNELHKFSDGTLTRVMEKLDQMVKDFHLYEYNKGMETRKWSEDDKRRSKDFITAIEKRLQIRRIYRSLESFVGGRIRDIDYRLINRTTDKSRYLLTLSHSELVDIETGGSLLRPLILEPKRILSLGARDQHPSETIVFHNEDGNPARANIKQALGYLKDGDGDGNSQPHKGVKASANSDVMYLFTSAQDGDPLQDDVRVYLGDDLKKAQDHTWEQFKELLRARPHHGFTELTQVDTFYNGLNENEQDSLNAAAGGNLLSKTTREALNIIENKSKVRYSRNRSNVSRMNATSSKTDERIDKLADQLSTLVEIVSKKVVTPALVKAVEETCVTCGGAHSWYNCPATDNNQASVCATTGTYNQVNPPNRVSNQMAPPGFAPVQNNGQNRFNQNQVQGNNFNRGNNFHGNQGFQAQNNHAPNFQNQGFQNQPFQVPNNQVQQEISNDFSSYKRNNDQMLRNMQNQINSLKGDLKNEIQNTIKSQQAVMMNQNIGLFQNQASTSGTLPSNTIPNPKGEMKAITTRSGVAYEGPSIPTNPSPKKVVERETEETTDKEQTNFQGSTAQIPPPVIPISIPEPDVPKTLPKTTPILESDISKSLPKPNIPYPSRHDNQK